MSLVWSPLAEESNCCYEMFFLAPTTGNWGLLISVSGLEAGGLCLNIVICTSTR